MDLELSPEQSLIRDTVRAFSKRHLGPNSRRWDKDAHLPLEALKELSSIGFLGALIPPEFGGAGLDKVSYALALEELAYGDTGYSVAAAVHTSVAALPILWFGNDDQKRRFLPVLASGEKLGAFAITEPSVGSEIGGIKTKAVRRGDTYVLDGEKVFITNGSFAGQFIVSARVREGDGRNALSLFVVDGKTPGLRRGGHEEKLGLRSSDTARMQFSEMEVPVANRLGAEGDGFRQLLRVLNSSRIGIAAQCLGLVRRALDESVAYAKQRKQFGVPLGKHQAIQFMIADMATRLEAARLLTYRAAVDDDRGELKPESAAMAKLFASETAVWAAEKAVQIHGGNGYIKDYVVERLMRDAPVTRIYEGTSEIQKNTIARSLARA